MKIQILGYIGTKGGTDKLGALKSYSIEKNKDKIEEKLKEMNKNKITEYNERDERD